MNDLVPSMGSRIQRKPLVPGRSAQFLAENAVVRESRGDALSQKFLRPAVRHGHRRVVLLQLDVEIVAAEVFERDAARLMRSVYRQGKSRLRDRWKVRALDCKTHGLQMQIAKWKETVVPRPKQFAIVSVFNLQSFLS